jgi:predicted permease
MHRDLRVTLRTLRRSPAYVAIMVAVLTIGIAANLVEVGFYKALVLNPLPGVTNPTNILVIGAKTEDGRIEDLSYHDYEFIRDHSTRFSAMAGTTLAAYTIGQGSSARRVYGEMVTGQYFQFLGVSAQYGRTLLPSDDAAVGVSPVAVLSDSLWRRMFGGDPGVIGRTATINGVPLTIVGVLSPSFHGTIVGIDNELFVPFSMQPRLAGINALSNPRLRALFALARPHGGIDFAQAQAELGVLDMRLARERPPDVPTVSMALMRVADWPLGTQTYAKPLVRLMGGTALLLLVTVCSNVAALVLTRCMDRRKEIAARLALGATRFRVVRLVVLEVLTLAVPSAALGFGLSKVAEPALVAAQNGALGVQFYFNSGGGMVVAAAIVLALATAVLCGVAPALRMSRVDLATELKEVTGIRPDGPGALRAGLVAVQITTAVVLLAGMAVSMRSFTAARRADPGFDAAHVTAVVVDTQPAGYTRGQSSVFYERLLRTLKQSPHVESAGLLRMPLLMMWDFGRRDFIVERQQGRGDSIQMSFNIVGGDHFRALRIPIVAGRNFALTDDASGPRVAIVNETLARRYFGGSEQALGRRVQTADWSTATPTWMTIVGVARDIKYVRLNEPPTPYVYLPHQQASSWTMGVLVRSKEERAALLARIADVVHTIDADVPVVESRMLEDQTRLGFSIYDVAARVLGMVGIAAVCLAALGVYGMVAYTVRQRLREIGIRMAIGAQPASIRRRFVAAGLQLGIVGICVGVAVAIATGRLLQSLLYGVSPTDPMSLIVASLLVLLIVSLAAAIPAWRASRLDPMTVLRHT